MIFTNYPNSVFVFKSFQKIFDFLMTFQSSPSLLKFWEKLERHDSRGFLTASTFRDSSSKIHCGKRWFNVIRRWRVDPVTGWVLKKRGQLWPTFDETFSVFRIFFREQFLEALTSLQAIRFCRGIHHLMQKWLCIWLPMYEVEANLEIRFEKITIKPSYGIKAKNYPDIRAIFIYTKEVCNKGWDREPIEWKLITNLPIKTVADAAEKLHWYSLCWKVEVFFKILKSWLQSRRCKT